MTTKRNTVSITLLDDEYAQLKELAEKQDRYISGQARHMLRNALAIAEPDSRWNPGTLVLGDAPAPPDQTHMASAGSATGNSVVTVPKDGKQEPLPG